MKTELRRIEQIVRFVLADSLIPGRSLVADRGQIEALLFDNSEKEITMSQKAFATLSLLTLLVAAPAFAEGPLKAKIPFDFHVGATRMAAGEYTITFVNPGIVRIVRDDRAASCLAITMAASTTTGKAVEEGQLVFNNYGGSLFLSKIWSPGYDQGRQLPKSKLEIEVARNAGGVQQASVDVAHR